MSEWNKDIENKIMRKYRFKFTARIVQVVIAIFLLYFLYMTGVNMIADSQKWDQKHLHNINLMLDWKFPNIKTTQTFPMSETDALMTQRMDVPLVEEIGKEDFPIGTIHMEKGLLPDKGELTYQWDQEQQDRFFHFYLPGYPESGKKFTPKPIESAWSTLEKVHEGTVAEMAFSITEFQEAKILQEKLEEYDLKVLWMPLYTGEFKDFEPGSYSSTGNNIILEGQFGISSGRVTGDDYAPASQMLLHTSHMEELQNLMLESMERLLKEEDESYYERFLGLDHLQERYDYLRTEGFPVYGAVVTGPVKELLKLKEIEGIHGAQVGRMEYWNWDIY
ncbi:anti sigma factor C-terminal domain-containing protein [Bacillus sp. AK031]